MAQDDRSRIVEALLAEARPAIEKAGTFVPFAIAVDRDGMTRTFRSTARPSDPEVANHLKTVLEPMMEAAEELRILGLCTNVDTPDEPTLGPGKFVQLFLEFADNPTAVDLMHPYRREKGGVTWGKASEKTGSPLILGPAEEDDDRPQYKKDGDQLLGFLVPFAEKCLNKQGGFEPFAAVVTPEGELEAIACMPPTEEMFVGSLRAAAKAKKVRASGICVDVEVDLPHGNKRTKAVKVSLDSAEGQVVDCYVPYRKAKGGHELGELFAVPGRTTIFAKPKGR